MGSDKRDDDSAVLDGMLDDLDFLDDGADFDAAADLVFDGESLRGVKLFGDLFGDANVVKEFYAYGLEDVDEAGSALEYSPIGDVDADSSLCQMCGEDTEALAEYYMVTFELWKTVVLEEMQPGMLCVGCLEGLLGRELVSEDFLEAPVNYSAYKSERLLARLGEWFRAADGPFASQSEMKTVMDRLSRERGW